MKSVYQSEKQKENRNSLVERNGPKNKWLYKQTKNINENQVWLFTCQSRNVFLETMCKIRIMVFS